MQVRGCVSAADLAAAERLHSAPDSNVRVRQAAAAFLSAARSEDNAAVDEPRTCGNPGCPNEVAATGTPREQCPTCRGVTYCSARCRKGHAAEGGHSADACTALKDKRWPSPPTVISETYAARVQAALERQNATARLGVLRACAHMPPSQMVVWLVRTLPRSATDTSAPVAKCFCAQLLRRG